jgi:4-hydroxybenzoate polyprenyltransferase
VCLALLLLVNLLLLPLPILFLFLVIIFIWALSYKMTSLTTFEAGALSLCFILGGVFFASFERGLEALDDKRHLIFIESDSLHLSYLAW